MSLSLLMAGPFVMDDRNMGATPGDLAYRNLGCFFAEKLGIEAIIMDYRLLSHGAKYPSGGNDIALIDCCSLGLEMFLREPTYHPVYLAKFPVYSHISSLPTSLTTLIGPNAFVLRKSKHGAGEYLEANI